MAKGQKRSNREIKKPKANKAGKAAPPTLSEESKAALDRISATWKKH